MRTTLILEDELVQEAQQVTNIKEKTALVHAGLRALIQNHARKVLIEMGGTDKRAKAPKRRKSRAA